jgi:hypothetical protein
MTSPSAVFSEVIITNSDILKTVDVTVVFSGFETSTI